MLLSNNCHSVRRKQYDPHRVVEVVVSVEGSSNERACHIRSYETIDQFKHRNFERRGPPEQLHVVWHHDDGPPRDNETNGPSPYCEWCVSASSFHRTRTLTETAGSDPMGTPLLSMFQVAPRDRLVVYKVD